MNKARAGTLVAAIVVSGAILVLLLANKATKENNKLAPSVETARVTPQPDKVSMPAKVPIVTNQTRAASSFTKRASDMTEEEKAKLAKDFKEKYRPTVEKWFQAYSGRIPFEVGDFTLERFHSCLGDYMYTFMIGDTTFTVQDSPKLGLKVSYLMTRKGAVDLNSMPGNGFVPDLTVPVTREEVIDMVKSDSGKEFKPNEVIIKPTAVACAVNGGAFVSILPTGKDPENGLNKKISMVFGSDGKLISYVRDPFF